MRPNIRVEIQNNLVESMEVDENEEGEVSDGEDKKDQAEELQPAQKKTSSIFMSDFDLLSKKDQEKLQERARRFHLNPAEIKNFTDEDLKLLHNSLGINTSNESNVRFEVIHMRGIEQMNAGDILDYFLEYAPVSVEWVDEESCNIVWQDKLSPARALHFMSKPVKGMPVRDDSSYFDNLHEAEEEDTSILVLNRNREIQLQEDADVPTNKLLDEKNSVDIAEITATIPPGYWRLGNKHPNSHCILLRYALKTDKKYVKVEHFSRYYKGIKNKKIDMSSGKEHTTEGIFGRNKEMSRSQKNENPWSVLAENWDEDAQFRERERNFTPEEPKVEIKNPNLRVRLGTKRKEEEMEEVQEEKEKPKKVKIPRMRMYADDEEEKIKRKKMLKKIDYQIKKIDEDKSNSSDLRTVLNMTNRTHRVKAEPTEPEVFDLGSTLKNRNRRMVFQIKREEDQYEERVAEEEDDYVERNKRRHTIRPRERRERYSDDEDMSFRSDRRGNKPQSKVAVVIKTQKKPAVASAVAPTVWSRVSTKSNNSDSDSDSAEEESDSQNSSESEDNPQSSKLSNRPGFGSQETLAKQGNYKSPLKIEINNDHFKRN